jgi:lipoic acid synthetase
MAFYERSLELLKKVKEKNANILTKSGFMVGVGEQTEEIIAILKDLRAVGCDIVTIGQYLAPSKNHFPVFEYVHPDVFAEYEKIGYSLGFKYVASGPLVRSSYYAERAFLDALNK